MRWWGVSAEAFCVESFHFLKWERSYRWVQKHYQLMVLLELLIKSSPPPTHSDFFQLILLAPELPFIASQSLTFIFFDNQLRFSPSQSTYLYPRHNCVKLSSPLTDFLIVLLVMVDLLLLVVIIFSLSCILVVVFLSWSLCLFNITVLLLVMIVFSFSLSQFCSP